MFWLWFLMFRIVEYKSEFLGEKFSLEINTIHSADRGETENIHNLSKAELKQRTVQVIDIAYDDIDAKKYKEEEDPKLFLSEKTSRGKLQPDWKVLHWRCDSID